MNEDTVSWKPENLPDTGHTPVNMNVCVFG